MADIVVWKENVDPVTKEISEEEMFDYRGRILHWGVNSYYDSQAKGIITQTVVFVEALDLNSAGRHPVFMLDPLEIEFE